MQGARLSDTLVQCVNRFIQQVSSGNKAASSRGSALILTPANQAGFVRPWLPMFAPPPRRLLPIVLVIGEYPLTLVTLN